MLEPPPFSPIWGSRASFFPLCCPLRRPSLETPLGMVLRRTLLGNGRTPLLFFDPARTARSFSFVLDSASSFFPLPSRWLHLVLLARGEFSSFGRANSPRLFPPFPVRRSLLLLSLPLRFWPGSRFGVIVLGSASPTYVPFLRGGFSLSTVAAFSPFAVCYTEEGYTCLPGPFLCPEDPGAISVFCSAFWSGRTSPLFYSRPIDLTFYLSPGWSAAVESAWFLRWKVSTAGLAVLPLLSSGAGAAQSCLLTMYSFFLSLSRHFRQNSVQVICCERRRGFDSLFLFPLLWVREIADRILPSPPSLDHSFLGLF